MEGARPDSGGPPRLSGPRGRRALIVTAVLAVAADGMLWVCARQTFAELPTAFWLMGVLAIVVDARPYVVANRRASSVILPSICFTFASSSSICCEMSTGLPSMIRRRTPFFRSSVNTKSSSSPYTLNTGARSSISVPSGRARIASTICMALRLGAASAHRGQCASPIVAYSRLR